MRLGIPSGAYLIHGTNRPAGVGMQVTHGCIRMFPEDIAEFYTMVPVKTQVNLVDQTTKVGWSRGTLFLERQAPLEGTQDPTHMDPAELDRAIAAATAGLDVTIDWDTARKAFQQATGVPVPIGRRNFSRPSVPAASAEAPATEETDVAAATPAPTPSPAKLDLSLPAVKYP